MCEDQAACLMLACGSTCLPVTFLVFFAIGWRAYTNARIQAEIDRRLAERRSTIKKG